MALFACGLLAIVAALVSPIDVLGEQLMVMHMVQHVLLLDIAPILLILGLTKVLLRPATRRLQTVERRGRCPCPPRVRRARVRRIHVAVAHTCDVRPRAAPLEHPC